MRELLVILLLKLPLTIAEPSAISHYDLMGINRKMNCQKYIHRKLFTRDYKNYDENAFRRE